MCARTLSKLKIATQPQLYKNYVNTRERTDRADYGICGNCRRL